MWLHPLESVDRLRGDPLRRTDSDQIGLWQTCLSLSNATSISDSMAGVCTASYARAASLRVAGTASRHLPSYRLEGDSVLPIVLTAQHVHMTHFAMEMCVHAGGG